MEGISKETLLKLVYRVEPGSMFASNHNLIITREELLAACEELDPWLPVADAPKDKWLLVRDAARDQYIGKFASEYGKWYVDIGIHVIPTHYKLLKE